MSRAIAKIEPAQQPVALTKDLSSVRVLILDDNEFDQQQIRRVLKSAGIKGEINCASNLLDFKKFAETGAFDFALIDFNLVDGSGLDALQILRKQPEGNEVLPIMVAGEGRMEVAVQAMKDGCRDFIPKQELSADRLRAALLGALERTSRHPELETHLQDQVQVLMSVINDVAISGLRPRFSRMLRLLRQASRTANEDVRAATLRTLDENCLELYEYCDHFSNEVAQRATMGKPH